MLSAVSASASRQYPFAPNAGKDTQRAAEDASTEESGKTAVQQRAEEREIAKLAARDREVRAHEAAHLAAAQGLAVSGAQFSYTTGPDGKRYAVGGEVSIDTSPARTPPETVIKAGHIRRAALAPAEPSAQDRAIAAKADRMAASARLEIYREQAANPTGERSTGRQLDTTA